MYIVGLGNPGEQYAATRHNVGFMMLDAFIEKHGFSKPVASAKYGGLRASGVIGEVPIELLYPTTFMNNSGTAVKKMVSPVEASKLIVVYDDVDVPFGEVKVSFGRGSGGHNGIASIIQELGTKDFIRVRVGVAPVSFFTGQARRPEATALAQHVLGRFSLRERMRLSQVAQLVDSAIETIVLKGVAAAMNEHN